MENKIHIRLYRREDRSKIRRLCYETAFMGDPPDAFFDQREILADAITGYYTDYEPESTFVAEHEGRIAGYLTGSLKPRECRRLKITRVIPRAVLKCIFNGTVFNLKIAKFLCNSFISFLKGEFKLPKILKEYPAHLHINVAKDCRKVGIGSKLIDRYMQHLKYKNIKGVHVVTISQDAAQFFRKKGFKVIYSGTVSHLSYLVKKSLTSYVLGKQI